MTLNVRAGISTFYESPLFRFLPDEQQPIGVPGESQTPVGMASLRGYGRMFTGAWKPYALVVAQRSTCRWRTAPREAVPNRRGVADHAAKSSARDLDRTIDAEVVRVRATVRAVGRGPRTSPRNAGAAERSFDGTLQQFRIGDVTMVDLLLTEEELTARTAAG